MDTLFASLMEFKADDATPGEFSGYASTFGNVDHGKDRCVKGCFEKSIAAHRKAGTMPAMYWMHDRRLPIGDWLDIEEDAKGLKVRGKLWLGKGIAEAERAYLMFKGTGPKGLSIGYNAKASLYDSKTGVRDLQELDLGEVSPVGYGMNPKALVTSVKSAEDNSSDIDALLSRVRGPMREFLLDVKASVLRQEFKRLASPVR